MAQAIILAGGESSRAKSIKSLLDVNGNTFIRYAIDGLKPFVNKIVVVTGKYHDELLPYLNDVVVVRNSEHELGMFSSVLTGVKEISDDFFILPVDCPFVNSSTYEAILKGHSLIRAPMCMGKRGHPLFVKKELIGDLLKEDIHSNLRNFIQDKEVEEIKVNDYSVNTDIDTYEEYLELKRKLERN